MQEITSIFFLDTKDSDKLALLNKVDGLHALVKSTFGSANENEKRFTDGICFAWLIVLFSDQQKNV